MLREALAGGADGEHAPDVGTHASDSDNASGAGVSKEPADLAPHVFRNGFGTESSHARTIA